MTHITLHQRAKTLAEHTSKYELARRVLEGDDHRNTLTQPILTWLAQGETGVSSKTMAFAVLGIEKRDAFGSSHPYDPADLRRCVKLLEAVPAMRQHMDKVAALSPAWARLVSNWAALESLLKREIAADTGKAPRTYRMMKSLIDKEAA